MTLLKAVLVIVLIPTIAIATAFIASIAEYCYKIKKGK